MNCLHPPTPPTTPLLESTKEALEEQQRAEPHRPNYRVEKIKPPYSYAQLITMAMEAHSREKVVLIDIYRWIRDNFAHYRYGDHSWQNSIRHNLSLNKQFVKIARDRGDRGKGSYWMLDPKSKDPYCIRRRNFLESGQRRHKPAVIRPQINPAVRCFLQTSTDPENTRPSPLHTDEINAKYMPQNDQFDDRARQKVKVEYNWEGYEYHHSGVTGVQLPLQLALPPQQTQQQLAMGSVGLSPSSSDQLEAPTTVMELRIPTPEWWGHQVTTASLMSPNNGGNNPLAKVFENLSSSHYDIPIGLTENSSPTEHPWQEQRSEFLQDDVLFTLEPLAFQQNLTSMSDNDCSSTIAVV